MSAGRTAAPSYGPIPSANILLIDDEDAVRRVVGTLLRRLGFRVTGVGSGSEALAALEQEPYDVMICDFRMPEIAGDELYKKVEQSHPELTGRVVFTSGDCGHDRIQSALAHGGEAVQKPYDIQTLLAAIRSVLTPRRQRQTA